jgi:hypothetical protein
MTRATDPAFGHIVEYVLPDTQNAGLVSYAMVDEVMHDEEGYAPSHAHLWVLAKICGNLQLHILLNAVPYSESFVPGTWHPMRGDKL